MATVEQVNEDATYFWHEATAPADLEVTQVYGYLVCPGTARVLVQEYEGEFNLPGGSPEPEDDDLAATLIREAMKESQVVVSDPVYLGYQEVHQPGLAPYAQVRMIGADRRVHRALARPRWWSGPSAADGSIAVATGEETRGE